MAALSLSITEIKPLDRWANSFISPGPVGSVGDCLIQTRLKHNTPDAPIRWAENTFGKNSVVKGTNLQDGMKLNLASSGGPAILRDSNWGSRRDFKTAVGWVYQDVRAMDNYTIPLMGATPNYSWNNQVATTFKANIKGEQFLPLPNGYSNPPGTMLRGGNYPRVADIEDFNAPPIGSDPEADKRTGGNLPIGAILNPVTQATTFGYSGEVIDRPFVQRAGLGISGRK